MTRIPPAVLATFYLVPAAVRHGLELILDDDRLSVARDPALALIQRLIDDPTLLEGLCALINGPGGPEAPPA